MLLPADIDFDQPREAIVDQVVAEAGYDRPSAEFVVSALRDEDGEPLT